MRVHVTEVTQGLSQLQDIIPIATTGAVRARYMCCNFTGWRSPKVSGVVLIGHIQNPRDLLLPVQQCYINLKTLVTVFLPVIQVVKNVVFNQVGNAFAHHICSWHQGNHSPRLLRGTPVIV